MKISTQVFEGTSGEFPVLPQPIHLVQVIKSGKCDLSFYYKDSEPTLLKAYCGAYFYTPPNFPQFNAKWINVGSSPIELLNIHFTDDDLRRQTFKLPQSELMPADCIYDDLIYSISIKLSEISKAKEDNAFILLLQNTLLFQLYKNNDTLNDSLKKCLSPMIELYINTNISRKITIEELANFSGMSKSNFIKHFKKAFNATPISFVKRIRLEKAREIIRESDKNFSIIAYELGYQSSSQFTEDFRNFFGVTPSTYRNSISG